MSSCIHPQINRPALEKETSADADMRGRNAYVAVRVAEEAYQQFFEDLNSLDLEDKKLIVKAWLEMQVGFLDEYLSGNECCIRQLTQTQGTAELLQTSGESRNLSICRAAAADFLDCAGIDLPERHPSEANTSEAQMEWEVAIREALVSVPLIKIEKVHQGAGVRLDRQAPQPLHSTSSLSWKADAAAQVPLPQQEGDGKAAAEEGKIRRRSIRFFNPLSRVGDVIETLFGGCLFVDDEAPDTPTSCASLESYDDFDDFHLAAANLRTEATASDAAAVQHA
eukprot:scaffold7068_cov301-Pinguiococcus_pyrenoidosus.AAC.15